MSVDISPAKTDAPAAEAGPGPLRVCFMIDTLSVGGTETQLLALLARLDRTRVRPYLCLLNGESEISQRLEPENCPTLRLGLGSLGFRALTRPSTLRAAWRFVRFLRRMRIDLLQVYFPDSTRFGVLLARLAGVRRIVGARRNVAVESDWATRCFRPLYRRAVDAVVCNCRACREVVLSGEGIRSDKVLILPNGIDLERFAAVAPLGGPAEGRARRVGMVANFRPMKGYEVLVRAAALVTQSHPEVSFRAAGLDTELLAGRVAAEHGTAVRWESGGPTRDVPGFLAGVDIAVMASNSEGLSNALLEYMAAGRAIVATSVGGNVELIDDEVHGLLIPPGDPQAMAGAIGRLLDDPALAARLGAAARRRAAEQFSMAAMVWRHEDLYLELVRGGPRRSGGERGG